MTLEQSSEASSQPMPVWLSIPIILICMLTGGWIIHWYVLSDPTAKDTKVLADAPAQAPFQGIRNRPNISKGPIQEQGGGRWSAQSDKARAIASLDGGKVTLRNVAYNNYSFAPEDARQTILATKELLKNQNRTATLKLTTQQVNRLGGLSANITMSISEADRQALCALFQSYIGQPNNRSAIEPKLLQLIDDVADRSTEPTKKLVAERAKQINQIMTPDLWKQNAAIGAK